MTHQRRYDMALSLRNEHPELDLRICADDGVCGEAGSLRSARKAWAAVRPGATHHMVLQDDVQLPPDMVQTLLPLLESRPDAVICLFVEWGAWSASAARIAALAGAGWVDVVDEYIPSQGIVMPADLARSADTHLRESLTRQEPDDWALMGFLQSQGVTPILAVPNVVEHDSGPSLTGNDHHGLRRSVCWMPGAATAQTLSRGLSDLDLMPSMSYSYRPGQDAESAMRVVPEAPSLDPDAPVDTGAHFWVRDGKPGRWRKVPARPVFADLGVSAADLAAMTDEALARFPGRAEATRLLGDYLLTEFWIAAFSLGMRAAQITTGTDAASRLDYTTPVADQALSTMAMGAFRNVLPQSQYDVASRLLKPLVVEGVRSGEQWSRAHRDVLSAAVPTPGRGDTER
ncbi:MULTISPECIES: hypothetical protein [unclassified Micromonospora]|uniref:hypothetical protein n=1 Tax=unclassified Micromonospora TaxID=2617518 RepID=UPI00098D393B|nr:MULTISPECIES: hypothetical protein [unclassified Micromonospora]MDI5936645.1 hypothetical protein [Micromonospora sp. DH15]OON32475.1 hypothetical protein BSA16_05525 [Micromonospora sp. Rc5]